jgi:hypothetical protein
VTSTDARIQRLERQVEALLAKVDEQAARISALVSVRSSASQTGGRPPRSALDGAATSADAEQPIS